VSETNCLQYHSQEKREILTTHLQPTEADRLGDAGHDSFLEVEIVQMKSIPVGRHIRIRTVNRFPAGMKWSGETNETLRFEDLSRVPNRAQ